MKQYVSWSEISSWHRSKEEWFERYIEGKTSEPNKALLIGKYVHEWMDDQKYPIWENLKSLGISGKRQHNIRKMLNKAYRKRGKEREFAARAEWKDGVRLFGFFDGFDRDDGVLREYKTSPNADQTWNQTRVDQNGQLSLYALIYRLNFYDYFRGIQLVAMDTTKGNVKTYWTARGPRDIDYIENKLETYVSTLKKKGLWKYRLNRRERRLRQGGAQPLEFAKVDINKLRQQL